MFHYKPKSVDDIVIRDFSFSFPDDIDPKWIPNQRVRSHFFNGVSLTMPYLEPFLVKTGKETARHVTSPELLEDIRGFCGQESQHYKCHRRLNELLKVNGYPELADVESRMDASWKKLMGETLERRLAYSAGFECMTNGFTRWMIKKRLQLFKNADPYITSFWLMHMIEETEHKTVALDCYMAYSGRFWPRFFGVFRGSCDVIGWGMVAMFAMLKKDGKLKNPLTWLELGRELFQLAINVGLFLLRALVPGHDPRHEIDPAWMRQWIDGYALLPNDQPLPLIDTRHPDMPVPFGSVKHQ